MHEVEQRTEQLPEKWESEMKRRIVRRIVILFNENLRCYGPLIPLLQPRHPKSDRLLGKP